MVSSERPFGWRGDARKASAFSRKACTPSVLRACAWPQTLEVPLTHYSIFGSLLDSLLLVIACSDHVSDRRASRASLVMLCLVPLASRLKDDLALRQRPSNTDLD